MKNVLSLLLYFFKDGRIPIGAHVV